MLRFDTIFDSKHTHKFVWQNTASTKEEEEVAVSEENITEERINKMSEKDMEAFCKGIEKGIANEKDLKNLKDDVKKEVMNLLLLLQVTRGGEDDKNVEDAFLKKLDITLDYKPENLRKTQIEWLKDKLKDDGGIFYLAGTAKVERGTSGHHVQIEIRGKDCIISRYEGGKFVPKMTVSKDILALYLENKLEKKEEKKKEAKEELKKKLVSLTGKVSFLEDPKKKTDKDAKAEEKEENNKDESTGDDLLSKVTSGQEASENDKAREELLQKLFGKADKKALGKIAEFLSENKSLQGNNDMSLDGIKINIKKNSCEITGGEYVLELKSGQDVDRLPFLIDNNYKGEKDRKEDIGIISKFLVLKSEKKEDEEKEEGSGKEFKKTRKELVKKLFGTEDEGSLQTIANFLNGQININPSNQWNDWEIGDVKIRANQNSCEITGGDSNLRIDSKEKINQLIDWIDAVNLKEGNKRINAFIEASKKSVEIEDDEKKTIDEDEGGESNEDEEAVDESPELDEEVDNANENETVTTEEEEETEEKIVEEEKSLEDRIKNIHTISQQEIFEGMAKLAMMKHMKVDDAFLNRADVKALMESVTEGETKDEFEKYLKGMPGVDATSDRGKLMVVLSFIQDRPDLFTEGQREVQSDILDMLVPEKQRASLEEMKQNFERMCALEREIMGSDALAPEEIDKKINEYRLLRARMNTMQKRLFGKRDVINETRRKTREQLNSTTHEVAVLKKEIRDQIDKAKMKLSALRAKGNKANQEDMEKLQLELEELLKTQESLLNKELAVDAGLENFIDRQKYDPKKSAEAIREEYRVPRISILRRIGENLAWPFKKIWQLPTWVKVPLVTAGILYGLPILATGLAGVSLSAVIGSFGTAAGAAGTAGTGILGGMEALGTAAASVASFLGVKGSILAGIAGVPLGLRGLMRAGSEASNRLKVRKLGYHQKILNEAGLQLIEKCDRQTWLVNSLRYFWTGHQQDDLKYHGSKIALLKEDLGNKRDTAAEHIRTLQEEGWYRNVMLDLTPRDKKEANHKLLNGIGSGRYAATKALSETQKDQEKIGTGIAKEFEKKLNEALKKVNIKDVSKDEMQKIIKKFGKTEKERKNVLESINTRVGIFRKIIADELKIDVKNVPFEVPMLSLLSGMATEESALKKEIQLKKNITNKTEKKDKTSEKKEKSVVKKATPENVRAKLNEFYNVA